MTKIDIFVAGSAARRRSGSQTGFSLIELMVAMAIGLFLVAVVGILFVNSKVTYLAQDASSRVQENSRYTAELFGRQIRTAGFHEIRFVPLPATADLFAPAFSFVFGGTAIAGTDGASNAPDTVTLSFDATTDCLGQAVTTTATNQFRINAQRQLECIGSGAPANPGVLLDDVEDMQVLYGQPAGANFTYVPAGSAVMGSVQVVRVCLMLRAKADSDARATGSQQQTYLDCQGAAQTATDGYLRRAMTMTFDLRNRLP